MNKVSGLALAAGVCLLSSAPALAIDPPTKVRLFHFADGDTQTAYVDFGSLDRSDLVYGWTYHVYDPPKTFTGLDQPVGSYWERIGGDCDTGSVVSYGIVALDTSQTVIFDQVDENAPVRRDAAPNSFDEALLNRVCGGAEPTDAAPFTSTKEAEDTVRLGNQLDDYFGLGDDSGD